MMTPEQLRKLRNSLVLHEGYRTHPYIDTVGKTTIGIGYNLTDRGIDDEWINQQYIKDVNYFYNQLTQTFDWFKSLNADRQIVLIDMCFMGWQHFLEFKRMFYHLAEKNYKQAAFEMLNSKWAEQTKTRAASLAQGMLNGVYNV